MIFVSKIITSYSFFASMNISNSQKVLSLSKIPSLHVIVGKIGKGNKISLTVKIQELE